MTNKLTETIISIVILTVLGVALMLSAAFMPKHHEINILLFVVFIIGVICMGYACNEILKARRLATEIDRELNATKKEIGKLHDYADDHAIRIDRINARLKDDEWFRNRVDVAYFRRDKYGNRFMPGHFYAEGDMTSCADTMTIEAIREVVGRESIQVGNSKIDIDKGNKSFKFKEGKV